MECDITDIFNAEPKIDGNLASVKKSSIMAVELLGDVLHKIMLFFFVGVFLQDETEFRDKLSPITVALNYSLDQTSPLSGLQLRPILDHYSMTLHREQVCV